MKSIYDGGGRSRCACGGYYYIGGWCFGCGTYHKSRRDREEEEKPMRFSHDRLSYKNEQKQMANE